MTRVVISFDDVNDSILTLGEPILTAAGFKATLYVSGSYLGESGKLTDANLATLYALGWDMGIQQWDDVAEAFVNSVSTGLTRVTTTATYTNASVDHLLKEGDSVTFSGAADPAWNTTFGPISLTDSKIFTFTCAGTETTPAVGQVQVVKAGWDARMPRAQTEYAITRGQDYLAALGLTRGNTHLAPATGAISRTVEQWAEGLGIQTSRGVSTQAGTAFMKRCFDTKALFPITGALYTNNASTIDQTTGADALGYVDGALSVGANVCLFAHKIANGVGVGTALTVDEDEFQTLITGLKERQQAGLLEVVTISELYNLAAGLAPRNIP
jgi:peptidoglycan/xylan/chitin deacetylase (PgdA/CDA1 family)